MSALHLNAELRRSSSSSLRDDVPLRRVSGGRGVLAVLQGECASCLQSQFDIVGSDDATTCSILFLRSARRRRLVVAHLDDGNIDLPMSLCADIDDDSTIEVYLLGGFNDSAGISAQITAAILWNLHQHRLLFDIRVLFDASLNTLEPASPRFRGFAFFCDSLPPRLGPVEFGALARGPLVSLRMASRTLLPLHRAGDDCLTIGFQLSSNTSPSLLLDVALNASDQQLLQLLSTSPDCEGPLFVRDLRLSLLVQAANADEEFDEVVRFHNRSGSWVLDQDSISGRAGDILLPCTSDGSFLDLADDIDPQSLQENIGFRQLRYFLAQPR